MAKGKKKMSELTLEEKLQAAFVPKEEQPYKVPDNWVWTTINDFNNYISETVDPVLYSDKIFELYSVPSSEKNYPEIVRGEEIGSIKQCVQKDDVLLCKINPRINRVWKVSKETENRLLASSEWIIVRNRYISSDYLMWCFRSQYFRRYMLSNVSGVGGSLMRAQPKYVKYYPVPVPPHEEQERIVSRIESVFAKLNVAMDKVQEVIDGFDRRRSVILVQAFSGKLTEKWRKENEHSLEEWKETTLSQVVLGFKYGSSEKSTYENDGMPVLRIPNIGDGVIDFSDMKFLAHEDVDRENQVHEDDILIIRSNGSRDLVGKCAIVPALEREYAYASFLIRIKPSEVILPKFLLLYLNSSIARSQMFIKAKSSSGIHNINSKELGAIKIKVPCLEEQKEIVRLCNQLLEQIKDAEVLSECTVSGIDDIKSAILSKAFRGELGTNDSLDEPAEELLKRILEEAPVEEKKKSIMMNVKVDIAMNKDMLGAVREAKRITPETLKQETGLGIDEFYEELKKLTESGKVKEVRESGEVYLEVKDAD